MKTVYKRILVTTDFSTHAQYAVERAIHFAQFNQAELTCLHVIDPSGAEEDSEQELIKKAEHTWATSLERIANQYPVQFVIQKGRVPDQIIRYISDYDMDLVFIGAHGTYYLNDYILGTNAEAVVKLSSIPVQLIRKKPSFTYQRILVSTDFSEVSKKAVETAYQAYPHAEFLLLHVADVWYGKKADNDMIQSLHKKLIDFLRTCDVDESRFAAKFIGGYPADDISKFAADWGAQLVVLGTCGHSLLHYILIGRVSERLIRINTTDMLITPPDKR